MAESSIITRFHYENDSPRYRWRLEFYKNKILPALLAQTDQDFDINIWCEDWQADELEALHPKVRTFRASYEKKPTKHFTDFTEFENTEGLKKYKIQIGLDSDDIADPRLIETIKFVCQGNKKILLSIQPIKLDIKTGNQYTMRDYRNTKRCSPCYAIYQPDFNDFKFAYFRSHFRMNQDDHWDKVIYLPEGFVKMAIHDLNDSTTIDRRDRLIK